MSQPHKLIKWRLGLVSFKSQGTPLLLKSSICRATDIIAVHIIWITEMIKIPNRFGDFRSVPLPNLICHISFNSEIICESQWWSVHLPFSFLTPFTTQQLVLWFQTHISVSLILSLLPPSFLSWKTPEWFPSSFLHPLWCRGRLFIIIIALTYVTPTL